MAARWQLWDEDARRGDSMRQRRVALFRRRWIEGAAREGSCEDGDGCEMRRRRELMGESGSWWKVLRWDMKKMKWEDEVIVIEYWLLSIFCIGSGRSIESEIFWGHPHPPEQSYRKTEFSIRRPVHPNRPTCPVIFLVDFSGFGSGLGFMSSPSLWHEIEVRFICFYQNNNIFPCVLIMCVIDFD